MKFAVDDEVAWISKSGGYEKLKAGTCLGICHAGIDPRTVHPNLAKLPKKSSRWAGGSVAVSRVDRYVVAVSRGGKSALIDFYLPRVSTVDRYL